jgi:dihydrolipoamide dehydrogenase
MTQQYDVAIIGAGTAGLSAVNEVRKRTDNFVLINDGSYGTTCARVGCMPSKTLIEAAGAYHRRTVFEEFGIRGAGALTMNIPAALARVRRLRDDFVLGTLKATHALGERNIAGRARFMSPDTLSVAGRVVRARTIIIATGSRPVVPEAWRTLGDCTLTTDDLFEQTDLPSRMAVVGLGPVGVEMAQTFARLGLTVTAFELDRRIGGLSDPVVNESAVAALRTECAIHLGAPAELKAEGNTIRVKAGDITVAVDKVLAALGRRPNVDGLGLELLGVELDKRGMPPFDPLTMQIADLPVFIAGDASNYAPVLHEAADEGHIAGRNAVAPAPQCYVRRTRLGIVFSDPNIAVVGRRFSDLEEGEGITGEASFARQGRALAAATNKGILRVYAHRISGLLLGAEMCAPDGEHLAHLLALAIQQGLSVQDLLRLPFYHPVVEEGLRAALRELAIQLPGRPVSDLAGCGGFGADALD